MNKLVLWCTWPLNVELCADVIVSAARRSISVCGGGAPLVQKIGGDGGAARPARNTFF